MAPTRCASTRSTPSGGASAPSRQTTRPASDLTGPDGAPLPADEAKVIRGFLRDDRLTTIPSQESKRRIVIRYLCDRVFTEDRPYPEKEVNQRLALFHPDVATLRRAMVDDGLLVREAGIYRRAEPVGARGDATRPDCCRSGSCPWCTRRRRPAR